MRAAVHVPGHALMLLAMILAMRPGAGAVDHLGGAGVLVLASIAVAPFARARAALRGLLLDLWAMALVLVAEVTGGAVHGTHAHGAAATIAVAVPAAVVAVGWAFVRSRTLRTRVDAAFAAATAAGLVGMLVQAALAGH